MIFFEIFWTFLKIGIFTFGGGAAMVALIQSEVTVNHQWLTQKEFTDILAVSQMTPGPVGINTATYTGYTAIFNAGYPTWVAVVGSLLATLAVIILPVILMIVTVKMLQRFQDNKYVRSVMTMLRMVVVGVIASAALVLVNADSFGVPAVSLHFIASVLIFLTVFVLAMKKFNPVYLMLGSGAVGILLYGLF